MPAPNQPQPAQPAPPPIRDINEFAQCLQELYGRAFAGMGRQQTYTIFFKFFARRVLKHWESKSGGSIDGEEEREEALDHLEELLRNAVDEFANTYFDVEDTDDE
jgi:hypothetical protein